MGIYIYSSNHKFIDEYSKVFIDNQENTSTDGNCFELYGVTKDLNITESLHCFSKSNYSIVNIPKNAFGIESCNEDQLNLITDFFAKKTLENIYNEFKRDKIIHLENYILERDILTDIKFPYLYDISEGQKFLNGPLYHVDCKTFNKCEFPDGIRFITIKGNNNFNYMSFGECGNFREFKDITNSNFNELSVNNVFIDLYNTDFDKINEMICNIGLNENIKLKYECSSNKKSFIDILKENPCPAEDNEMEIIKENAKNVFDWEN